MSAHVLVRVQLRAVLVLQVFWNSISKVAAIQTMSESDIGAIMRTLGHIGVTDYCICSIRAVAVQS